MRVSTSAVRQEKQQRVLGQPALDAAVLRHHRREFGFGGGHANAKARRKPRAGRSEIGNGRGESWAIARFGPGGRLRRESDRRPVAVQSRPPKLLLIRVHPRYPRFTSLTRKSRRRHRVPSAVRRPAETFDPRTSRTNRGENCRPGQVHQTRSGQRILARDCSRAPAGGAVRHRAAT